MQLAEHCRRGKTAAAQAGGKRCRRPPPNAPGAAAGAMSAPWPSCDNGMQRQGGQARRPAGHHGAPSMTSCGQAEVLTFSVVMAAAAAMTAMESGGPDCRLGFRKFGRGVGAAGPEALMCGTARASESIDAMSFPRHARPSFPSPPAELRRLAARPMHMRGATRNRPAVVITAPS